jgi:hypothetical protein
MIFDKAKKKEFVNRYVSAMVFSTKLVIVEYLDLFQSCFGFEIVSHLLLFFIPFFSE